MGAVAGVPSPGDHIRGLQDPGRAQPGPDHALQCLGETPAFQGGSSFPYQTVV